MGPSKNDLRPDVESIDESVAAALAAATRRGWTEGLDFELLVMTREEVVVEWSVDERQLQPQGIVHGGVYSSVVETCCSVGALLAAPKGKVVVGVENHTSFIRPVREGRLRARAIPLHAGQRAQLWECNIVDPAQRLVATGRLRVLCVDAALGQ
jgi:uncharacterized protein (TIGR00369 family)